VSAGTDWRGRERGRWCSSPWRSAVPLRKAAWAGCHTAAQRRLRRSTCTHWAVFLCLSTWCRCAAFICVGVGLDACADSGADGVGNVGLALCWFARCRCAPRGMRSRRCNHLKQRGACALLRACRIICVRKRRRGAHARGSDIAGDERMARCAMVRPRGIGGAALCRRFRRHRVGRTWASRAFAVSGGAAAGWYFRAMFAAPLHLAAQHSCARMLL